MGLVYKLQGCEASGVFVSLKTSVVKRKVDSWAQGLEIGDVEGARARDGH